VNKNKSKNEDNHEHPVRHDLQNKDGNGKNDKEGKRNRRQEYRKRMEVPLPGVIVRAF
jgi:hypothetical protein